jgi:ketosteroid isomerase-like protein
MSLEKLEAEYEIRQVMARYARGIDRKDRDLVRSCYHPDATDEHLTYSGSAEGYIATLWSNDRFRATHHHLGAPLIEIRDDVAEVETYCTSTHIVRRDEDGPERVWILWVRYEDRFEKRLGAWRIAERVVRFDCDVVFPVSESLIPLKKLTTP